MNSVVSLLEEREGSFDRQGFSAALFISQTKTPLSVSAN